MLIPPDLDAATRVLPATDVVFCPVLIDRERHEMSNLYTFSQPLFLSIVDVP